MLLLGAVPPREDQEFLYSPEGGFRGGAGQLLRAVGLTPAGKPTETVQAEFQAAGFFVTHILECPFENGLTTIGDEGAAQQDKPAIADATDLLRERLPFLASRIRRSLKPKYVILITEALEPVVQDIVSLDLGCPVLLNDGKPFHFSDSANERKFSRFREALPGIAGGRTGRASGAAAKRANGPRRLS